MTCIATSLTTQLLCEPLSDLAVSTSGKEPTRGPRVPNYCYSSALQNGGEYPSGRKYVPYNEVCSNIHQN